MPAVETQYFASPAHLPSLHAWEKSEKQPKAAQEKLKKSNNRVALNHALTQH